MNVIRTRLHVAEDGTITGHAPGVLPAGDHDAEIVTRTKQTAAVSSDAELWSNIRALQDEVARLPVLDARSPEAILGYNVGGTFD
jgi:hypothetical protein